jgi:hypothetical protein
MQRAATFPQHVRHSTFYPQIKQTPPILLQSPQFERPPWDWRHKLAANPGKTDAFLDEPVIPDLQNSQFNEGNEHFG